MSGAEFAAVIGLTASIVQVLDASKKVVDRVKKYRKGVAFEDVLPQLQLFISDIEKLQSLTAEVHVNKDEEAAFVKVLDGCFRQLSGLNLVIQEVAPAESSSKIHRTWMGLRSFGKDSKIREFLANLDQYKATLNFHLTSWTNIMAHERFNHDKESRREESYFKIPARQVSNFVGRSGLLQELKDIISAKHPASLGSHGSHVPNKPNVLVLTGLGGLGKSQVAMRLCQEFVKDFRGVFWINSSSKETVSSDFDRYAGLISNKPLAYCKKQDNVERFISSLAAWEQPWLLIFDNYDNPRSFPDVASFFPASTNSKMSTVLMTSRNSESGRLGHAFQLDGLSDQEGLQLLLTRSQHRKLSVDDLEAGKRIVSKLGYLPLAIDQASSYISARQMPLDVFEREYERKKTAILAHTPRCLWEYQRTKSTESSQSPEVNLSAFTTWEFSIEQITDNKSSVEEMLTQVAFLDASSISEALLKHFSEYDNGVSKPSWVEIFCQNQRWDSARFQDIIVELLSMSLIQGMQYEEYELSFSLHPVVKDWLQLRISSEKRQQNTCDAMFTLANHISTLNTEALHFETRRELIKHVDACQLNIQKFLDTEESRQQFGGFIEGQQTVLATFYANNDRSKDAIRLYYEVLNLQEARLGISNLSTLSTMNNLGILQLSLGDYESAYETLDRVLIEKERILPLEHERVLNTVINLGNTCTALGYFDRATELSLRAQRVYESDTNTKPRNFVAVYNNLGEIELRQGRVESASAYFQMAMRYNRCSAHEGEADDEVVCHVLENQAKVYELQRSLPEAISSQSRAATSFKKLLGVRHPRCVASIETLGDMFHRSSKQRGLDDSSVLVQSSAFAVGMAFLRRYDKKAWNEETPNRMADIRRDQYREDPKDHAVDVTMTEAGQLDDSYDNVFPPLPRPGIQMQQTAPKAARTKAICRPNGMLMPQDYMMPQGVMMQQSSTMATIWSHLVNRESQYHNKTPMNQSQVEPPGIQKHHTPPPPPMPKGWIAQWDAKAQKFYYVEISTGVSTWEMPKEAAPGQAIPPRIHIQQNQMDSHFIDGPNSPKRAPGILVAQGFGGPLGIAMPNMTKRQKPPPPGIYMPQRPPRPP